jgi:hypothetical protein
MNAVLVPTKTMMKHGKFAMNDKARIPLVQARGLALEVVGMLGDFCERISIAGVNTARTRDDWRHRDCRKADVFGQDESAQRAAG